MKDMLQLLAYCIIAAALEKRRLHIGYEDYSLSQVQVDSEPSSWRAFKEKIALYSTAAGPNSLQVTDTAGAFNWLSLHLHVPHIVHGVILRGTEYVHSVHNEHSIISFSVSYSIDGHSFELVADPITGEMKASMNAHLPNQGV